MALVLHGRPARSTVAAALRGRDGSKPASQCGVARCEELQARRFAHEGADAGCAGTATHGVFGDGVLSGEWKLPQAYDNGAFAAEHGSWNREDRAGYEVIRIPMPNGKVEGSYQDFLTGFVVDNRSVWGRPVGVAIGRDGSMFVTDDGSRSVWHITYKGKRGGTTGGA